MGVAALVLGIVSLVIGFIPFCGMIAFIPAVVGVVLGAIDFAKKKKEDKPKGMALAGLILSIIAILIMLYYFFILSAAGAAGAAALENLADELQTINTSY